MTSTQYSERFLNFVQQQLMSFQADQELEHVVVYVARSGESGSPTLEVVGPVSYTHLTLPTICSV